MAALTTAATVPILRDRAIFSTDVVALALKVIRMTAGTVRLVGSRRPVHHLRIVLVALRACQVATMVQRLVGQASVHVDVRNPGIRRVAGITFLLRDEMPEVLAGGNVAVVTGRTRAENLSMVGRDRGTPCGRRVTGLTHVRCQRMHRALTRCINAVVTAKTVVDDIGVVEVRRYPGHSRMAIITIVAARDMPGILTHRDCIVMARNARAQYLCVIDTIRRLPDHIVVAVFAKICR